METNMNETTSVAYQVYKTKDYNIFKRLTGNRDVAESRINAIIASIQTIGWVHNPIVVNDNMEVIDGQGRLAALQRLKLPVEYVIAPGTGATECIHMNMNMINWKLPDYIKSYAERGDENYQRLLNLMETYVDGNLHIITTAVYKLLKSKHREIKAGTLQLTEEEYQNAIPKLEFIQPLYEKIDLHRLPGSIMPLMQVLIYYFDYPEIDKRRLAYCVEKYIYNAAPWVTHLDCGKEVEDAYNYNMRMENRVSIAHLIKEERRKIQAKANQARREKTIARTQKGIQGFVR